MKSFLMLLTIAACASTACKSPVKEQEDRLYSRHLQRPVSLKIITTPLPKEKADMHLLLINNSSVLERIRAKKIIDSLYTNKLISPLTAVAFSGEAGDYGLEETGDAAAKQHKQFNDFVIGELYPFIKKKTVIRKFRSVTICGFGNSAISAFDIAWNNDDKIQRVGMFYPEFSESRQMNDSAVLDVIRSLRKRPGLGIWLSTSEDDSSAKKFSRIIAQKKSITEFKEMFFHASPKTNRKQEPPVENFAEFLIWAFPVTN